MGLWFGDESFGNRFGLTGVLFRVFGVFVVFVLIWFDGLLFYYVGFGVCVICCFGVTIEIVLVGG